MKKAINLSGAAVKKVFINISTTSENSVRVFNENDIAAYKKDEKIVADDVDVMQIYDNFDKLEKKTKGKCKDCGEILVLKTLESGAGYYIGTECCCGPNSRDSGYYGSKREAENALKSGDFGR